MLEEGIRRNQQTLQVWPRETPQTLSERVLLHRLQRNTKRAQKELSAISPSLREWNFKEKEPDLPLEDLFQRLWRRLLTRWRRKGQREAVFLKAVDIFTKPAAHLTVFITNPVMPLSNQAIETDHGRLKECWRKSAGRLEAPYMLECHGHSLSLARNVYQGKFDLSPLEILGFSREEMHSWMTSCSQQAFQDAKKEMNRARDRRRRHLRASREPLTEIFKEGATQWLEWTATTLQQWLADHGRLPENTSLPTDSLNHFENSLINSGVTDT